MFIRKELYMVATPFDSSFKHFKVDRRHLRTKYGIILHFLFKYSPVSGRGDIKVLHRISFPVLYRRKERADSDSSRTEVIYLIYLKYSVYLACTLKDITYLICSYRIQTAAKGVKLNQIKSRIGLYIAGSLIKS